MGPKFFQTMMGSKFFDSDVPAIGRALARIAAALEARPPAVRIVPPEAAVPVSSEKEWVCAFCGGNSVEVMMWVLVNAGEIVGDVEPVSNFSTFCNSCDGHHGVMLKNEYLDSKKAEAQRTRT